MYRFFRSEAYEKRFTKLDTAEQRRVINLEQQIKENPFTSKPLGYPFLREKRINGGKRILFIIYEELQIILFAKIATKRDQQDMIDDLKEHLKTYQEKVRALAKGLKLLSLFLQEYLVTLSKDLLYRLYLNTLVL